MKKKIPTLLQRRATGGRKAHCSSGYGPFDCSALGPDYGAGGLPFDFCILILNPPSHFSGFLLLSASPVSHTCISLSLTIQPRIRRSFPATDRPRGSQPACSPSKKTRIQHDVTGPPRTGLCRTRGWHSIRGDTHIQQTQSITAIESLILIGTKHRLIAAPSARTSPLNRRPAFSSSSLASSPRCADNPSALSAHLL